MLHIERETLQEFLQRLPLRKKCSYLEFLWFVFSRIRADYGEILTYLSVFSPNVGKYGPEKLRIRTLWTRKTPNTDTFYAKSNSW